jgi:hypothetical protein
MRRPGPGGAALLLLSHDDGRLTNAELGATEGGSSAPSMELHVEEAARSPCDCHAQSCRSSRCDCCARSRHSPSSPMKTLGEMDDNEVDETSSKQRERLLALLSVASATSAVAPPPPVHTPNLLLTAWSTSTTATEALALLCSISLSLSSGRWQRSGRRDLGSREETNIWSIEADERIISHRLEEDLVMHSAINDTFYWILCKRERRFHALIIPRRHDFVEAPSTSMESPPSTQPRPGKP